jgi:hypothetical protein
LVFLLKEVKIKEMKTFKISKDLLFILSLTFVILLSLGVYQTFAPAVVDKDNTVEAEIAIARSRNIYKQAVLNEINLSSGPCLSNDLMPGWVLDIVHSPREEIDNLPGNQCQAYVEGRAKHIVEFDLGGNVVRVK